MWWQVAEGVPVLLSTVLGDCGLVISQGCAPFHHSWLIPSLFPSSSLVLQSQPDPGSRLTPSLPACSEAGLLVGDGFLAKLFQVPPLDF